MIWLAAFGIAVAFVLGALVGAWWNKGHLKAAEATAAIAADYCQRGLTFYERGRGFEQGLEKLTETVARFADEQATAAQKLEAMDRSQGAMLSAFVQSGLLGAVGGTETRGRGHSEFTGG